MKERRFKKMPIVVKATQWFKNGDHPEDDVFRPFEDTGKIPDKPREGAVVGYYRSAFSPGGQDMCSRCGELMYTHGQLRAPEGNHVVCPGDWIITDLKGECRPCKPDIFEASYEEVEEDVERESPAPPPVEIPRRVVVQGEHGWGGKIGTVIGEDETRYHLRMETASKTEVRIIKSACTELRLSKEEQARLLLEKLSREAWEEKEADVLGDPNCYVINLAGEIRRTPHERCDPHTIRFPDSDYAEAARDTIIRAGLAWWTEGSDG